jgi:hypothetical protein
LTLRARAVLLVCCLAAVCLAVPGVARAADRFADPAGDGAQPCAESDPCDIVTAINGSSSGDDITLLPGTYTTSTPLGGNGAFNRTIHGAPGARPTVNFTAPGTGEGAILLRAGSVIRDVAIESTSGNGAFGLFVDGGTIERVSVHETGAHASGPDTRACAFGPDTVMRDSVCWYSGNGGSNATALLAQSLFADGTATIRNVTAISTSSYAIRVLAASNNGFGSEASMDLSGTNVIAKGGGVAGQEDVRAETFNLATRSTATFDHSNYATESETALGHVTDPGTGSNVTTDPAFANAATGDFHQLASSTGTRNLGTASGMNSLERDIDGQSRLIGSAPDIGADEYLEVPAAPTITGTNPLSPSNENNPLLVGTAEPFSSVHVFASNDCSAPEAGAETAEEFAAPGIGVTVPENLTTTFSAKAVNGAGPSACSTGFAYTEDSIAPVTTIDSAPSGTTTDNTPSVSFHASDLAGVTFGCKLDSGASLPCTSPSTFGPIGDGTHTITVTATDAAGNVEASPASVSFTVSTVQPVVPIPAPHAKKKCKKKKHRAASVAKKKKCKKKRR